MAERRDQQDVLPKKGNVTTTDRGLQQWGSEGLPDAAATGTGGGGTAERAARITDGQLKQNVAKDEEESS